MTANPGWRRRVAGVAAATMAMTMAACSGGSGPMANGSGGGAGGATIHGAVQGFAGGLQVGGVTFRTTGAQLRLPDDSPAPVVLPNEDAVKGKLDDGMVVTVRGTLDDGGVTGQAAEIEFRDAMEGTIDDRGAGWIRVLGTDVAIDDATHVEDRLGNPKTQADLGLGIRVEVSGHGDAQGGMKSTLVRIRDDLPPAAEREVKGYVAAIRGAIVDLALTRDGPIALHVDLGGLASPPAIAVGDLVEVRTMGGPDASGNLVATAIEVEVELEAEPGAELEVEGIVTAVASGGFTVAGQKVVPDADAVLVGGTADDLVVGVEVEAEGTLGADGVLHAHELKFEASARIDANLSAKDATAGTLTLIGITVHVSPSTELRGFAALAELAAGDALEIRGRPTKDGLGIDATRVERVSTTPSDRAFLRSVVTAVTPNTGFTLLGIAIDASGATFQDASNAAMGASGFFSALTPGKTLVKVRWRPYPATTAQPIDEAELEN